MKKLLIIGAAAMLLVPLVSLAEDAYRFIISGDPVVAASAGMTAGESVTGPLDVRHHAVAESRAMALTSVKNNGFIITIK